MEKLDLTKRYKNYYNAKTNPEIVEIEKAYFISICGKGDPDDKSFADRIEALYTTAYVLKFASKTKGNDFVVSKLEALWWFDNNKFSGKTITTASTEVPRSEWEYRLLIRLPDFIKEDEVEKAKETAITKKGVKIASQIEFYRLNEGKSVQMLHIGPFSTEPESLAQIGTFMSSKKLTTNGLHHEIYLSDFRKTEPDKLKTILREPVQ